jgi:hypothetical protein
MREVFDHARTAIKNNPGCKVFADRTTKVLNLVVRPLTAKWHRASEEGRLNGRDGADEFRGELETVQEKLQQFAAELHVMAYGIAHADDLSPDVMKEADMEALFHSLQFGFTPHTTDLEALARKIAADEHEAIARRRDQKKIKTPARLDAVGLALSGGGIRSATFCLGVTQVLAEKGFLKEVDYLSTVSGGGYTGSFLTQRLGNGEAFADVASPQGPDPESVRYIRQRAKFLSAHNLKEKWSMVTATLAGMLLNWTVPFLVIVVFALIATYIGPTLAQVWPTTFSICAAGSIFAIVV